MMEVQDWGGGLTQHEVDAIEKIKQAFQASENNKKVKGQGFDALKSLKSIFPWKGYSGFRFADIKGSVQIQNFAALHRKGSRKRRCSVARIHL